MIATRNGFEVLRFPVMQSSFSFTSVELLAVPKASLINNPGHLSTGESVFAANHHCPQEGSPLNSTLFRVTKQNPHQTSEVLHQ